MKLTYPILILICIRLHFNLIDSLSNVSPNTTNSSIPQVRYRDNENNPPKIEDGTSEDNSTEANDSHNQVELILMDINDVELTKCNGMYISNEWVISSASCLNQASSETQLQVCTDPANCVDIIYADRIVFPRHEYHNNMAFVHVNDTSNTEEKNITMPDSRSDKEAHLMDCIMSGSDDIAVNVRRGCRRGYYCVDDPSGAGCGMANGVLLVCEGKPKGILTGHHDWSCRYGDYCQAASDEENVDNEEEDEEYAGDSDDPSVDNPIKEDRFPLLFFIRFDSYRGLIESILDGSYNATIEGDDPDGDNYDSDDNEDEPTEETF